MITIRRVVAAVALAAVLAAGAGPAWAGEFNETSQGSYVEVPPTSAQTAVSSGATAQPTVVHVTASGGFRWGDAAIGAAAAIAVAILVIGGGMVLTQRKPGSHIRHA